MSDPESGSGWENAYEASLHAEDLRQGRVPGRPTASELFIDVRLVVLSVVLVAVALGWGLSLVGLPYIVGTVGSLAVLIPLALLALRKEYRSLRDD